MEYLVIRLEGDRIGRWAVFDGDGRIVRRAEIDATGAIEASRGRRVVALVPGVEVISTTATLPSSSPGRLRKMLPYALEDVLAEDIDDLFFAVGPRLESGALSVAVVARARLEAWLDVLDAHGISAHAIFSDAEGVPDTPSTLTLVIEGERVYARAPAQPPFVFEGLTLEEVLEAVGAAAGGDEPRHAVVYVDDAAQQRYAEELRTLSARMSSSDVKLMADGALYRLAATLASRPGTNLLQGPYAPKSNWQSLLRPWRAAASLLVGFILLLVIGQAAEYIALRQEDRALTGILEVNCEQSFASRQLDACEAAVRSRLSESGLLDANGDDGFLTALSAVASSRSADSRIEALSYRNAAMDLQLVVPDIPALDAFAQQIESSERFDVVIQSANAGASGVEGRLQLIGAQR